MLCPYDTRAFGTLTHLLQLWTLTFTFPLLLSSFSSLLLNHVFQSLKCSCSIWSVPQTQTLVRRLVTFGVFGTILTVLNARGSGGEHLQVPAFRSRGGNEATELGRGGNSSLHLLGLVLWVIVMAGQIGLNLRFYSRGERCGEDQFEGRVKKPSSQVVRE